MSISVRHRLTLVPCLFLFATASSLAQPAQPKIRSGNHLTIKPDRVGDFLAAVKEYVALQKKGGSERYNTLWVASSGPREYVLVENHQKWAEFDTAQEPKMKDMATQLAAVSTRIIATIESSHRILVALANDLSVPMPAGEPPQMVRVVRTWVRPEHSDAFAALVKSDLLPAAKKAGLKLWSVGRVSYGGSRYQYEMVSSVANWAELDGDSPIVAAMGGQAAYSKFLARQRPMVSRSEYQMYRWMKDQSYLPEAK